MVRRVLYVTNLRYVYAAIGTPSLSFVPGAVAIGRKVSEN